MMHEIVNTNTGRAYVEYESKEDMDKAISYMNGVRIGKGFDASKLWSN